MAINKVGRVLSMDPKDAAKSLPPEVIKMAADMKKSAGGGTKKVGK